MYNAHIIVYTHINMLPHVHEHTYSLKHFNIHARTHTNTRAHTYKHVCACV